MLLDTSNTSARTHGHVAAFGASTTNGVYPSGVGCVKVTLLCNTSRRLVRRSHLRWPACPAIWLRGA